MSGQILLIALGVAQVALGLAAILAGARMLRGPRAQDRVLALDALTLTAMLSFLVTGMRSGSPFFFEAALVIAVAGFTSTVALARFLLRGEVIE